MNNNESAEQIALFEWADYQTGKYPELALMYHIPNGGRRDKVTASILKAEGVKPGVPDICLPVPCGKYHGMYIELKYGKNQTTQNQDKWLAALSAQGYLTTVCYGFEDARLSITQYLRLPKIENLSS